MIRFFQIITLVTAAALASVANAQTTNYPLPAINLDFCRYNADEHENALHARAKGQTADHWVVDMHPFKEKWGEQAAVNVENELIRRSNYLFANPGAFKGMRPDVARLTVYENCVKGAIEQAKKQQ